MKIRYFIRFVPAFLARFKGVLGIGVLLGLASFVVLQIIYPALSGQTQRIGITGRYQSNNLPNEILTQIGSGLTHLNEAGEVEPDLAESWEVKDEGKTWIFHLKKDLKWQDGKEVTADTVNYTFEDVRTEIPDKYTLVFKLDSAFAPFPAVLAKPAFKKGLLGTGEWRVTDISLAGNFVQKLILKNKEGNRQIIKFYPTEERTKLAFELGEVDVLQKLINPEPFNKWSVVKINEEVATDRFVGIFFNTQEGSLADKSLRQALSYAIDKNTFNAKRALGPISPNSWAYNPQIKPYDFSRERAKELLTELPDEVQKSLEVKLVTTPALLSIAEKIASDWEEIGIKTSVQVTSILPNEYQAFLAIYDVPQDPDQYSTWHSTQQETNITKYSNPRIDKLLEDGRLELDKEERKKIYLDFQRFLLEDAPAVFLYHPTSYSVTRK